MFGFVIEYAGSESNVIPTSLEATHLIQMFSIKIYQFLSYKLLIQK